MIYSFSRKAKKKALKLKKRVHHHIRLLTDHSPKLLVLAYHRVLPKVDFNPLNTIVSVKTFESHLDMIARRFSVISFAEAAKQSRAARIGNKAQAILTFDDGYADNYEVAFPILKRKGLPASFFVSTGYIGRGCPLWDYEVITRILNSGEMTNFAFRIFDELKSRDFSTIEKVVTLLRERVPQADSFLKGDVCLDWEQIRRMAEAGMEIGAHGITHRSLSRIPLSEAIEEIRESKSAVEKNTGRPCLNFAFPFGSRRDYSDALIGEVKKAGFNACLLNIHGYNHMRPDFFSLRRIIMDEDTDLRFLLG